MTSLSSTQQGLQQVYGAQGTPIPGVFQPPIITTRDPTSSDYNFKVGRQWVNKSTPSMWFLGSKSSNTATWIAAGSGTTGGVVTLTGDSGGALSPTAGNMNIVGGTGASVSGSGSTLTINVLDAGLKTTVVTAASATMTVNARFVSNNAGLCTLTLPATALVGDVIQVTGLGAGGWQVAQNAGQTIHYNSTNTTTGATGHIDSSNRYNAVTLVCVVANTDFVVEASSGIISVT